MKLGLTNSLGRYYINSSWNPSNLSGLTIWLQNNTDITESDGTACEDNDAVHGWRDQSGNNNNATGAATRFTFDAATGGIEGTGNNKLDITQINFTGQFAFYARLKFDTISSGANDVMFNDATGASDDDFFRVHSTLQLRAKIGGGSAMNYDTSISTGTFFNIGFERDGSSNCRAYLNGVQQDSEIENSETFNLDRLLGAFDGICKEIVITNTVLSSSDRSNLQAHLNNI
ncbi:MAG: hypothetical protein Unbinned4264contig1000_40 [Prokaryotic dsDNA virus sp.]|nr:MAG: hypothetical protein Unbinned4264contig1000_40 [Prokaryotic dsDNA virus sp.]|tara:strand:+ start:9579 stop:10268 length:690 start_codon:yes stop_codon:yes gene_type:complete